MIVENGKYYLYRHIRLDTGVPFYIGVGTKTKRDVSNNSYYRAKTKSKRSLFWKNITSKSEYEVEVVLESDDRYFIQQKEIEFIQLYGRRDLNKGDLVNLTDGADNGLNKSKISIEKQLNTAKSNGSYYINIDRIKKMSFKKGSNGNYQDKKTYLYNVGGIFLKEFDTRQDCGKFIGTSGEEITSMIRHKKSAKGFLCSNIFLGDTIDLSYFTIKRDKNKKVNKLSFDKKYIINTYNSLTEAAKSIGVFKTNLYTAMKKGYRCKEFYWEYVKK